MKFYYTYMLESEKTMNRFYIGFTEDLESRLKSHNHGNNPPTSKYKPWRIKTAIAFTDRQKVLDFEKHLKNPPGGTVTKKYDILFWNRKIETSIFCENPNLNLTFSQKMG